MSIDFEQMIKADEGLCLTVYTCTEGKSTVGYGHNLKADPAIEILKRKLKKGDHITIEEAQALLDKDINKVYSNIRTVLPETLLFEEKYRAVIFNMVFNLGISGVKKFKKMLAAMKNNNESQAIVEIRNSQYYRQVPNRANRMIGLINGQIDPTYYKKSL